MSAPSATNAKSGWEMTYVLPSSTQTRMGLRSESRIMARNWSAFIRGENAQPRSRCQIQRHFTNLRLATLRRRRHAIKFDGRDLRGGNGFHVIEGAPAPSKISSSEPTVHAT